MKQFNINEELANAVFHYLSTRPYREVAGLMAGLGRLEPVNFAVDEEKKESVPKETT